MKKMMLLAVLAAMTFAVGCGQGESPQQPSQPSTPNPTVSLPPVSGPQWLLAAKSPLGVEVYFEIFYACNCPNYARTFMFWDAVGKREISRAEFTLADAWWTNYNRPEQDFQLTPDGTRLGVRMYKSGRFFDTYRIYDLRSGRELKRITRSLAGKPFLIDDQNGATTGIRLTDTNVTLTIMVPSQWSESGDTENPDVYGTFSPNSEDHVFPIPSAF